MAAADLPDLNALRAELDQLEHEERELSTLRRKLHDRLASFPNPHNEARERELSARRRELHRRIDALRVQLRNVGFYVGPPGPSRRD
jgi:chromosome segregation ATPase